jgi:hypothetical protein
MLSEAFRKKRLRPTRRRELAAWFLTTFGVSVVRACALAQFSRAGWYKRSAARDQYGAAAADHRAGARAAALWLSADLGAAAPRGLAGQQEARVQ